MSGFLFFVLGFFLGAFSGTFVMALCFVGGKETPARKEGGL